MSAKEQTGKIRCAIYTRKSTEEGLDQDFNSLDAQHEACAAFVASQSSLGWRLVPERYDDGGISGGTMERPALRRLLDDIREHRVNVIVVYKIDRLTRSLADFAKMVEIFDAADASFVSVTQQFNTTTSMGRLTLNVLLSFAQFEREVTAERIRDKIAASKKKGMWMGGPLPLGYRVDSRKLIVHLEEADIVRFLFRRYLELKSVRQLSVEASEAALGARLKADGSATRLRSFCRGNLYHLLANPIYVGKIRHRDKLHDGQHEAIIDQELFDEVQKLLATQAPARRTATNCNGIHLLTGIVRDENGELLRPVHTSKKGVHYRYYVSREKVEGGQPSSGWRLPASELEFAVERQVILILSDRAQLSEWIRQASEPREVTGTLDRSAELIERYGSAAPAFRRAMLKAWIRGIVLRPGTLTLRLSLSAIVEGLTGRPAKSTDQGDDQTAVAVDIDLPFRLRRRGVETRMVLEDNSSPRSRRDNALIDLILRANLYLQQVTAGKGRSLSEVAALNGTDLSEISRLLPLAFLAPGITAAIFSGRQPVQFTAQRLSRLGNIPLSWSEQQDLFAG